MPASILDFYLSWMSPTFSDFLSADPAIAIAAMVGIQHDLLDAMAQLHLGLERRVLIPVAIESRPAHPGQRATRGYVHSSFKADPGANRRLATPTSPLPCSRFFASSPN